MPGVRSTPGARKSKMLIAGGTLVIGSAAAFNFLMARPKEQISDLALANIELFATPCKENIEIDDKLITVTVCDRSTSVMDRFTGTPCDSPGTGACVFTNR